MRHPTRRPARRLASGAVAINPANLAAAVPGRARWVGDADVADYWTADGAAAWFSTAQEFSICARFWVTATGAHRAIMSLGGVATAPTFFVRSSEVVRAYAFSAGAGSTGATTASTLHSAVYRAFDNDFGIYLDGVETNWAGTLTSQTFTEFSIGVYRTGATIQWPWAGHLSEVVIIDGAVSDANALAYQNGGEFYDPADMGYTVRHHWVFADATGDPLTITDGGAAGVDLVATATVVAGDIAEVAP